MEVTTFQYPMLIIEKHLDTFGHVNNATYLELYEEARWDFIEKNGWGLKKIQSTGVGPVILELNLKFKRELKNREKITITSVFKEMKNSKVMVLYQQMLKEDGTLASELELDIGVFDLKERSLIKPEQDWLRAVGVKSL
ncbi:MAG: thioesterase [Halobacteriovorax sp.]|nr:thioesterase [Halobacteriovorax sp.]|tara:strand:- start:80234 stop:80650 length:417 start_codon:yes stop_codon:yes gene_type:complete